MIRDLWTFFVHLRWHYQVLILPGGYLLGALYVERLQVESFLIQFLSVHLLLNGGVTAYNSYFDDDDGPIGGLMNPPKMKKWMHPASLLVQLLGLPLAFLEGPVFVGLYVSTMGLSVLYSSSRFRWKSRPLLSLVCVGVGTGTNTFLMGYLAAGPDPISPLMLLAAVGVATLLLSMYPVSQIFQIEEDRARGDNGFAVAYGRGGVRRFFVVAYLIGLAIVAVTLQRAAPPLGLALAAVGLIGGLINGRTLFRLQGNPEEYQTVMRLKYGASMSFVLFVLGCLIVTKI